MFWGTFCLFLPSRWRQQFLQIFMPIYRTMWHHIHHQEEHKTPFHCFSKYYVYLHVILYVLSFPSLWHILFRLYDSLLEYTVAHLVKTLRYKLEGRRSNSWWGHCNSSLTWPLQLYCGSGIDSASNRNQYQVYLLGGKGGWCVRLTI